MKQFPLYPSGTMIGGEVRGTLDFTDLADTSTIDLMNLIDGMQFSRMHGDKFCWIISESNILYPGSDTNGL